MSTKTASQFLERVQRSGLISEGRAAELLVQLEQRGIDLTNANAVADALVADDTLTRWQADKLLQGKHRGFFLGSYRLLKMLGKGGMGAVYLAYDRMLDRKCAIKVLPPQNLGDNSSMYERFVKEAIAVAALNDENIVKVFVRGEERSGSQTINYFVMEYVDGEDLQHRVQRTGVLDFVKTAEYIRQAARGLAHAHAKNLVHRDIKPANLLVARIEQNMVESEIVKILDLGLARRFDDDDKMASLTSSYNETVLGTADYLSPEQALDSHDVDSRTDIYSLGCTAYFLLTGHPPFPEGSVAQRLIAHQVKQPNPIIKERPDAPRELVAIVEKMMAKQPADRFQSATEVVAALTAWLIANGGEEGPLVAARTDTCDFESADEYGFGIGSVG
jgi:serine/threonine protein kinase